MKNQTLTKEAISTIVQNPIDFDFAVQDKRGGVALVISTDNILTVVAHINKWGTDVKGSFTFNGIA